MKKSSVFDTLQLQLQLATLKKKTKQTYIQTNRQTRKTNQLFEHHDTILIGMFVGALCALAGVLTIALPGKLNMKHYLV